MASDASDRADKSESQTSGRDNQDRILPAERILHVFLGVGVGQPLAVDDEQVFVATRLDLEVAYPSAVADLDKRAALTNSSEIVGCGAANFTGSAFGAIGLTDSVFAATVVDGSAMVPFVFDVLGVFVLLAIIGINSLRAWFVQMKPANRRSKQWLCRRETGDDFGKFPQKLPKSSHQELPSAPGKVS